MKQKSGGERLLSACQRSRAVRLLEKYIQSCQQIPDADGGEAPSGRRSARPRHRVPNLAGFCRYLGIGWEEFSRVTEEFPEETQRLYAVLEDEALNSALPPAVLSAYLKRRLGYEREEEELPSDPLQICFEHDILSDGE